MPERLLRGAPAAPGVALAGAWRRAERPREERVVAAAQRPRERERALAALAAAAVELETLAAGLPADEAEIVRVGILMAADPALTGIVEEAIVDRGVPAGAAILAATDRHAAAIAAIGDATLAARADDVLSLGRRAARLSEGETGPADAPPSTPAILLAADLGPSDVAELAPSLAGVAMVGGGATAHAAIVARSLGLPMVTGLDAAVLAVPDGTPLALDGTLGSLIVDPGRERARAAAVAMAARARRAERAAAERDLPAVTRDRHGVTLLANVASVAELDVALGAGAAGVGLLRTELAFLEARDWPTEAEHARALEPILAAARGLPTTVRVLDFGADKSPPFLRGARERGLELLLANPDAFEAQLRAILAAGRGRDVRILLPMVDGPAQVAAARGLIERSARAIGSGAVPPVGAMIETPAAADAAAELAACADFLSIGSNDLTATTLGADRFAAGDARTHDPRVLRLVARSVTAAHAAGIAIEVCGEAASDPLLLPLLVGLGVDELSVGAARVGTVRGWIRRLSYADARRLARAALELAGADEVEAALGELAAELRSVEGGDAAGEGVERGRRVPAFRP